MASPAYKKLRQIFAKAAKVAVIAIAAPVVILYGSFVMTFYNASRGDKLTPGEKVLVESIFGDEIKASKIRKHQKEPGHITHILRGKTGTVMPFTSHIDFFGKAAHARDYSTADVNLYGLFVHESTHTFQNQHGMNWKKIGRYGFELTPGKKFEDYGVEEQADIIEDYAKKFLHPDHVESPHCKGDPAVFYQMLQKVVEDRFPRAKETRLQAEARENQKPTAFTVIPKISNSA